MWWQGLVGLAAGLAILWLLLLLLLWHWRPDELTAREALRLLPDVLRLVGRLARDRSLPWTVRVRLWLLVAYLAMPLDLVPDVIPVIGYADDVVLVLAVLRSVVRRAGRPLLEEHWPGSPAGLEALLRLSRTS
jgi:uncharacterized membrane protein YkvA (DUF1232 family)